MKVKELIKELSKIPQEKEVVITAMDDGFYCSDFELHSYIPECDSEEEDIEIILPYYFSDWVYEPSRSYTDEDEDSYEDDYEDEEIF